MEPCGLLMLSPALLRGQGRSTESSTEAGELGRRPPWPLAEESRGCPDKGHQLWDLFLLHLRFQGCKFCPSPD